MALELIPEMRDSWDENGTLEVDIAHDRGREEHLKSLKAIPKRLDLVEGRGTVTVHQRRGKEIPGSREYPRLALGDITGGRVLVWVSNVLGEVLVRGASMPQGDHLSIDLCESRYVLDLTPW